MSSNQHQPIPMVRIRRKVDKIRMLNFLEYVAFYVTVTCLFLSTPTIAKATNVLRAHSPYLYAGDSYPVIEYILSHNPKSETMKEEENLPSFLFDSDPRYRIVEFYSSRNEPIALRIRDTYIQLAYKTSQLLKEKYPNVTLDTYGVSCRTVPSLCEVHGIDFATNQNAPVFMMYKPGSSVGIKLENLSVLTILDHMGISSNEMNEVDDTSAHNLHIDLSEMSEGNDLHLRTISELKDDIHLSLYTFIKDHVFVDHDEHENLAPLSTEKRAALKKFLLLMHKSLPSSWPVYGMVRGLIDSFMYICRNRAYLLTALDAHPPEKTEFSTACQVGMSHVSGLTCGTWELIHAITVGVVERNKMVLSNVEMKAHAITNVTNTQAFITNEDAAMVLRDFVHYFGLGDDEIERQLIIHSLDQCKDEHCLSSNNTSVSFVSHWIKLPLFFSKVHSTITLKRQKDISKQKHLSLTAMEQQMISTWPPKYACPQCWDEHGKWDTNVVYKYMQLEYTDLNEWSLSSPEIRQELLGVKPNAASQQRQLGSDSYSNSSSKSSSSTHIALIIQQIVVLVSALGVVAHRAVVFNQQKQHAATLVLPQTIWTKVKVQRNKSLKQHEWLGNVFEYKKS